MLGVKFREAGINTFFRNYTKLFRRGIGNVFKKLLVFQDG